MRLEMKMRQGSCSDFEHNEPDKNWFLGFIKQSTYIPQFLLNFFRIIQKNLTSKNLTSCSTRPSSARILCFPRASPTDAPSSSISIPRYYDALDSRFVTHSLSSRSDTVRKETFDSLRTRLNLFFSSFSQKVTSLLQFTLFKAQYKLLLQNHGRYVKPKTIVIKLFNRHMVHKDYQCQSPIRAQIYYGFKLHNRPMSHNQKDYVIANPNISPNLF